MTRLRNRSPQNLPATLLFCLALLAFALAACGGPPTESLDAANKALLDAAWAEECAADTYRSAQKMLEEARAASDAGEYDEAKRKADASLRLAEQARKDAELNREECEKRKNQQDQLTEKLEGDNNVSVINNDSGFKLHTVYFDFNESILTEDSQQNLQENGDWLLKNQTSRVRIEGHTDDRGSTEYNLALSQRRAQSVKRFLQTIGVDSKRMTVIPYGEEKPASYGSSESDHASNRRAEFVTQ